MPARSLMDEEEYDSYMRQYNKSYQVKNADKIKKQRAVYRANNVEKIKQQRARHRAKKQEGNNG